MIKKRKEITALQQYIANNTTSIYHLGIDIGSTTFKVVVLDEKANIILSDYRRHNANIPQTTLEVFGLLLEKLGDIRFSAVITGSVGMGYATQFGMKFAQEVIASAHLISKRYPHVHTFIDIGGEDSKMIFFEEGKVPDIRMNGSCAGGTGAFIDQVASLLNVPTVELNAAAENSTAIYPIASRCGVFSKTDIQNLISRNVSKNDIAASVFNAVAIQVVGSLARGTDILPKLFFCGGPFAFLPYLHKAFLQVLKMDAKDCIIPENAQLVPATGCAMMALEEKDSVLQLSEIISVLKNKKSATVVTAGRLPALFSSENELHEWTESHCTIFQHDNKGVFQGKSGDINAYLGVDSGSTTTKIVLLDEKGELIYKDYRRNNGDSFNAFAEGLKVLDQTAKDAKINISILGSGVTGYGENLLKTAFNLNYGIVETIAHFIGAQHVSSVKSTESGKVDISPSFVLDIGGQDMKAIFVENDTIKRIEINEACSSGCGSFIETFARQLNYSVEDFAKISCLAQNPCDLGTRCTVFMNSKVKQSLSEGANVADIAAGFSYSVIKNCLFKVLKLRDVKELGNKIVVQGGTFKNLSIVRALELLTGQTVHFSDIPELMGAFGAALYAKKHLLQSSEPAKKTITLQELINCEEYSSSLEVCPGCENHCTVKIFNFKHNAKFFSGNNCERIYSNRTEETKVGINQYAEKYKLLFDRTNIQPEKAKMRIGIPRGLGIFENYPFWHAMFNACGFLPVLSKQSSNSLYESGIRSIMADNICFPAKLMHGHVKDLVARKVDRIFYPFVVYEHKEDEKSRDSYNCPIVSGYSDVLKSSMDPATNAGIPFDSPVFSFADEKLLRKSCTEYLATLQIDKRTANIAVDKAIEAQKEYLNILATRSVEILNNSNKAGRLAIVLAGRPYHVDPLIQHKLSNCISEMGIDVVTENIGSVKGAEVYNELLAVTQWAYPNRIFKAAYHVATSNANVHFVQLNSFGCGPDAFILDEVGNILRRHGKNLTILKIDDVNNIGSLRLRIRSLVESLQIGTQKKKILPFVTTPPFGLKDQKRDILVPYFADGYSEFIPQLFKWMDYNVINLPIPTQEDAELGLKYANNEICYPATIVVGSIIKFLQAGDYDPNNIAIGITQTGGQCRASNYLSLIKNAMISAGFGHIPVVSGAFGDDATNNQPGFQLKWNKIMKIALYMVLYADCISKMYHASIVREKVVGAALKLKDKYIEKSFPVLEKKDTKALLELLKEAVREFEEITDNVKRPIVGLVGEIYLRYNAFSQKHVTEWLEKQKIEVVVPSIYNFFMCSLANTHVHKKFNVIKPKMPLYINDLIFKLVNGIVKKFDNICADFKFYRPFANMMHELDLASRIINPATNFGEGWMLPAEMAGFAENNINNIISLQPFGCIANQVISKGIEKRMKKLYPHTNFLFLDFDSGMSEANIFNRLHFIAEYSKK